MDPNVARRQAGCSRRMRITMTSFTCPTLDLRDAVGWATPLSAHRTSQGTVRYLRCRCGGLLLVDAADRVLAHGTSQQRAARQHRRTSAA